mmetsp:Transcript_1092/g.3401  ORF Transcript_1092/g.3401 Transcript_1092/m.3401 type:complete len:238 (+) Transcript_1092:2163-2876(+)
MNTFSNLYLSSKLGWMAMRTLFTPLRNRSLLMSPSKLGVVNLNSFWERYSCFLPSAIASLLVDPTPIAAKHPDCTSTLMLFLPVIRPLFDQFRSLALSAASRPGFPFCFSAICSPNSLLSSGREGVEDEKHLYTKLAACAAPLRPKTSDNVRPQTRPPQCLQRISHLHTVLRFHLFQMAPLHPLPAVRSPNFVTTTINQEALLPLRGLLNHPLQPPNKLFSCGRSHAHGLLTSFLTS